MENTIIANFYCDYVVAQFALTITDYQSVEAAAEYIFDQDDFGCHRHPFIGYRHVWEKDEESGGVPLKCFIC